MGKYTFDYTKNCQRCGKEFVPTNGRQVRCIACKTDEAFVKEQHRIWAADWRANHPDRKTSQRNRRIARSYKITSQQYDDMLKAQDSRCAICKQKRKRMHLDHDHDTGKVRAFLCSQCNTALGMLKEDPQIVKAMFHYLRRWQ